MEQESSRMFISVNEIQDHYLPFSKKKIRKFILQYVPYRKIGRSIYVEKEALDAVLKTSERKEYLL